jgi:diguanylate cyclase (GGDEF)-like protein
MVVGIRLPDVDCPDKGALLDETSTSGSVSQQLGLPADFLKPTPFVHRLGVKHGVILAFLVLLAMSILTTEQLRETLREIRQNAIDRGNAVAAAIAPLVTPKLIQDDTEPLRAYFNKIASSKEISYVQVIDSSGTVVVESDPGIGDHPAAPLNHRALARVRTSTDPQVNIPWDKDDVGVDVLVPLLDKTAGPVALPNHLRIGVNFDTMIKDDTPRVIRQMLFFTVIVGFAMVMGLVVLLSYILYPLRQLRIGFMNVAAGNLDYRVPTYSKDEVGQVVQAFNGTIARLRRAFVEIEELARRDALTNLPNRRAFDERLASEAARSRRYGHPFGLIILDLDHFKDVNDRYGHPTGDEVLKLVGHTIMANIRETDMAARIGGEEFGVLLPESGSMDVMNVAEKLRESILECEVFHRESTTPLKVTVSAGGACSGGHLVTQESIMTAADAALYRSKNEGRNRVTIAPSSAGKTAMLPKVTEPDKGSGI